VKSTVASAAFVAACVGCTHTDLPTNAPGHVEVSRAPGDLSLRVVEPPSDPGERMVLVGYGGFVGVGEQNSRGIGTTQAYGIGPEVSIGYGVGDTSHTEDEPLLGNGVLAERGIALNLGWTSLSSLGKGLGPLYAEVEFRRGGLIGVAGGWTWDPDDRTQGPQATVNFGPLYARVTTEIDLGTQVTLGIVLKGEHGFVWSR